MASVYPNARLGSRRAAHHRARRRQRSFIDINGARYLDGISSLWVNLHGHRKKTIDDAIRAQLDRVAHSTLLGLANVPSIELAERLIRVAPPGLRRVFYSDSGSTAVEIALKMAFQYQQLRGHTRRTRFIALKEAYHGDTIGAVSVGGMELFHQLFQPLLFHVEHIEPTEAALASALADHGHEVAAFIVEPLVQGAAGMLLQPTGFLKAARDLCNQHGVLLIADEVATGFGRTGTLFACERAGMAPDLMCLAKGISGGYLPLAATLTTEAVYDAFCGPYAEKRTFFHGHSYTGNPLACAAGIASLDVFAEDRVLERLPSLVVHFSHLRHEHISPLRCVRQVRQCGTMVGIELVQPDGAPYPFERAIGAAVCLAARKHGVLLRPLGPVVVILPPLSITDGELSRIVAAAASAIAEICA